MTCSDHILTTKNVHILTKLSLFKLTPCKDPGFERMIRDGINSVIMVISVDLCGFVQFGAVSLRIGVQWRY